MAHISKKHLKAELDSTINASSGLKTAMKSAYSDLVDTAVTHNIPIPAFSATTTSESATVAIEVEQPANTILTDIIVLCTSAATLSGAGEVGLLVGTTAGASDVVAVGISSSAAISDLTTTCKVGQGCSIHQKLATVFSGSVITILPQTATTYPAHTSVDRTLHFTISASANVFITDTGAFKPTIHYARL